MLDQRQQARAAKAIRIAGVAIECAKAIKALLPVAFPRKRPRICKRMPARAHGYRHEQARMQATMRINLAITAAMGAAQVHIILSQPIPKYPQGGHINDNEQETIRYGQAGYTFCQQKRQDSAGASALNTNAIQPLPTR